MRVGLSVPHAQTAGGMLLPGCSLLSIYYTVCYYVSGCTVISWCLSELRCCVSADCESVFIRSIGDYVSVDWTGVYELVSHSHVAFMACFKNSEGYLKMQFTILAHYKILHIN